MVPTQYTVAYLLGKMAKPSYYEKQKVDTLPEQIGRLQSPGRAGICGFRVSPQKRSGENHENQLKKR